jgi:tRNA pseudouridine55 synthase
MNGILVIDKAEGMTSHDVVQAVRNKLRIPKVGHLGTLDPMATGVLPVSVGKATRLAQFLPTYPKEYEGEMRFGFSTTTYDREGAPTSDQRPLDRTVREIHDAMRQFVGTVDQIPPPFSAKKIGGVPSYKFARANLPVEIAPARVEVHIFELVKLQTPLAAFRVVCSAGTYVRSLVHELGRQLGCGAHLTALRRTRSGDFRIENAFKLEQIGDENVVPMDRLLSSWPRIEVSGTEEIKILHGNQIPAAVPGAFARIFNKKGEFIALASLQSGWARPRLVLTSTNSD